MFCIYILSIYIYNLQLIYYQITRKNNPFLLNDNLMNIIQNYEFNINEFIHHCPLLLKQSF